MPSTASRSHSHDSWLQFPGVFACSLAIVFLAAPMCGQVAPASGGSERLGTLDEVTTSDRSSASTETEMQLAGAYLTGKGEPKDPARAAYWYRKAADRGNQDAQNELGYLYMSGIGVPHDEMEASKWFARAMGGGSQEAKLNLALLYLKGDGRLRDVNLGTDLLRQLAEKGNAHAEDILGVLYLSGYGVQPDRKMAEKWFARAAKGKNPEGEYEMGNVYFIGPDHVHDLRKAAKFLRRSGRAGYVPAMYMLGVLLLAHPEIAREREDEPIEMLRRAAEAGAWQASARLGRLARDGRERPRNLAEAFRWFLIEEKQGGDEAEPYARADLAGCRQALSAEQQDEELHRADDWMAQHRETVLYVLHDGANIPLHATYVIEVGGAD